MTGERPLNGFTSIWPGSSPQSRSPRSPSTRGPQRSGFAYTAGLVHRNSVRSRTARKQLRRAGPRLVQLGTGISWWLAVVVVVERGALRHGTSPSPEVVVVALVLRGYARTLVASLAYVGLVLAGGGHAVGLWAFARRSRASPGLKGRIPTWLAQKAA